MKAYQSLEDYKAAAMRLARIKLIDGRKTYFAQIPGFRGVWGDGKSAAESRRELAGALEGWIEIRLEHGLSLPSIKGVKPPSIHFA